MTTRPFAVDFQGHFTIRYDRKSLGLKIGGRCHHINAASECQATQGVQDQLVSRLFVYQHIEHGVLVICITKHFKLSSIEFAIASEDRNAGFSAPVGRDHFNLRWFFTQHFDCRNEIGKWAKRLLHFPFCFFDDLSVEAHSRHLHEGRPIRLKQINLTNETRVNNVHRFLQRVEWNAHFTRKNIHRSRGQHSQHRVRSRQALHHLIEGAVSTRSNDNWLTIICKTLGQIAGFTGDWTMGAYREQAIQAIRDQVGDKKVICGLSGGVDSSVAAILIHEAIGDQLTCVFVDHGLLRKNEAEEVVTMFRDNYNIQLIHADESDLFLGELDGQSDPETKRKIIGKLFIDVFQKHADTIEGAEFLAQGTLYPDVIESVSFSGGPSVTIKSHHNVGGLPEKMGLKLVEPLRELFKDEVRALGRELGLPQSFIGRHPFPGPGLAIRCPGEITREKLEILRKADAVYIDQIRKHGLYDEIWQAFAAILPVRTVGVMGDGRTYDYACALRAVTSVDGMTADYYPFSHDFLGETATRIINEVKGINRVTYDITSKPPGTIEWE